MSDILTSGNTSYSMPSNQIVDAQVSLRYIMAAIKDKVREEGYRKITEIVVEELLHRLEHEEGRRSLLVEDIAFLLNSHAMTLPYHAGVSRILIDTILEDLEPKDREYELYIRSDRTHPFSETKACLRVLLAMGGAALEELFGLYETLPFEPKIRLSDVLLQMPTSLIAGIRDLKRFLNDSSPWVRELANELVQRAFRHT